MEVELAANADPEEETFEVEDENVGSVLKGERCGICMEIIIDRGLLDCCQDWFCFACIDNWATITNLCPLCQNEFQLITCIPVYDTIGSNDMEEDSFSTDEDWCIEGKSSTLSFPSYYIDENAVICLDGDGCKIRSRSATLEEDSNLDTSIACDSCDIWYHAFCVGFDTEATSENTWLCPRCVVDEMRQKSDMIALQSCSPDKAGSRCMVDATFSGKVSVSVADSGETALVVSMVGQNQKTDEPNENFSSTLEAENNLKIGNFLSNSEANGQKSEMSQKETSNIQQNLEVNKLDLSLSQGNSSSLPPNSSVDCKLKTTCSDKAVSGPSGFDGFGVPSNKLCDESHVKELSRTDSCMGLHLGLSVSSFLSVDDMHNEGTEYQVTGELGQHHPSDELLLSVNKTDSDAMEDVSNAGVKRKRRLYSDKIHSSAADREVKAKIDAEVCAKKIRAEEKIQMIPSKGLANEFVLDASRKSPPAVSDDDKLSHNLEKENAASDIFSIVQGTNWRTIKGLACPQCTDKDNERGNEAGLRVKKIMRRASGDKESSVLVQKLREEIKEAVRYKSSAALGKNLFDPKLLSAFRVALAGPKTDLINKISPSVVRAKKSMLQKGRIRDNLTKKIYGTYSGRRRRAWDRECEIEFWKHRCMRVTKPEKIETLKSVLNLLRNTENVETHQMSKGEGTNPILSRLYLADTSVFPRKNDIRPFSILDGDPEQNKEHSFKEKANKLSVNNCTVELAEKNRVLPQVGIPLFGNKGNDGNFLTLKGEAVSGKLHPNHCPKGPCVSVSGKSKGNSQKETVAKSGDIRSDKRKWALEVLARKAATPGKSTTHEKQDLTLLRGNYPLLAQLPVDMRPVLAPSRHNKIPISVRQAQLYRLTEHFLRKANLSDISRTAVTELAIADAINIEKGVADRSNSKLVYVNLCSQELLHHSENVKSTEATGENLSPTSMVSLDKLEQASNKISTDPLVEEALRTAGLLSDSPPNSPVHVTKELNDEDDPSIKIIDERTDNVIEIDSNPELDIYGDFDYDLEDEDYIGADALKLSQEQPEDGELKIKLVFSTLNLDGSNHALDSKDHEVVKVIEGPPCSPKCRADAGIAKSGLEGTTDKSCLPSETSKGEDEVPSPAECEELYGPDREPLLHKLPEGGSNDLCKLVEAETSAKRIVPESESCEENLVKSSAGGNSPIHSQVAKDIQGEKIANTNIAKKFDGSSSVCKKVEAYIKEHIRPLCKSGVITAEQYRWAVAKTTEKVIKYHSKDKNANFLIKEGEKVKKLAEQYIEAFQQKEQK